MEFERLFKQNAEASIGVWSDGDRFTDSGGCDAGEQMAVLLEQLDRFVAVEVSSSHAGEALGCLEQFQTRVASNMCNLARRVATDNPGTDTVDVLKQKTRLSERDANKLAKVADRLYEMPRVAEKFAEGDITLDHAAALANAAERVGPEAVDADRTLLEESKNTVAETFSRRTRDWVNRQLIEAGVDIVERQRQARDAKLWTDPNSGMGMLFAKLPPAQFNHLQEMVDRRYLQLLRDDETDGRSPDEVLTPR